MKNVLKLSCSLCMIFGFGMLQVGCNELTAESLQQLTPTTGIETQAKECCGKCKTGNAEAKECCGKCNNVSVSKEDAECCGKCSVPTETKNDDFVDGGCENGCNACSEGDPADCKCGETTAVAATGKSQQDVGKRRSRANSMAEDRDIFHFLLRNHDKIKRTVTNLDNGVKTVTESSDAKIAKKIQQHVASMHKRVEDVRPLRMWDELFREIFKHADKIKMEIKKTEKGVSVVETSDDAYVVKLIQAHAKAVSGFVEKGFQEARKNHGPPSK